MGSLDYPSPGFGLGILEFFGRFFTALFDMGDILVGEDFLPDFFSLIARIGAEILLGRMGGLWPVDDGVLQSGGQQFDVMHVGAAGDEGERDPTGVHQQAALATVFFPDLWGWGRRILLPVEL